MLVLGVTIEVACRRFQNVGGRYAAGRNAPFAVSEDKSSFRLGARKAELTRIAGQTPGSMILP